MKYILEASAQFALSKEKEEEEIMRKHTKEQRDDAQRIDQQQSERR